MDRAGNQQIYEQKDANLLYKSSHIRENLREWLSLEGEDRFLEIPVEMPREEILRLLHETDADRMMVVFSNPGGVEVWNRGKVPGKITLEEVQRELQGMGYRHLRCYYPYPNHFFPMKIYSQHYLPHAGELRVDRMREFRQETLMFRDEEKIFDELIETGRFEACANSYLLVAEKGDMRELPVFVQYANDRAPEFQMKTEIWADGEEYRVFKKPMGDAAGRHGESIMRSYQQLKELVRETRFTMNRCEFREDGLELEFLTGKSLAEKIRDELNHGNLKEARALVLQYVEAMRGMAKESFCETEEFREIFGADRKFACESSMRMTDIDLIFQNILLGKREEEWNVIDYEWSFAFPIPVDFVIYRAFETFCPTGREGDFDFYELYPVSVEDRETYAKMEQCFQAYVSRDYHTLNEMYESFGKSCQYVAERLQEKDHEIAYLKTVIRQMENTKVWKCYRKYRDWVERK